MQTAISEKEARHPDAAIAEKILRSCVHCGFCNATCPTYRLSGSELEGPRGRIYLIKGVLEGRIGYSRSVVDHLDNCLSCLACETTCPSGVRYSHLIDSARARIEQGYRRGLLVRAKRWLLARLLPDPRLFRLSLSLGRLAKPVAFLLPSSLRSLVGMIPLFLPRRSRLSRARLHPAEGEKKARVALLTGCAQQVLGPEINDASLRLLKRIGCEVVIAEGQGCCGALVYHMGNRRDSLPMMKNNIDRWEREMQGEGLDYIVINTSGCGVVVRDYGHIFRDDPEYAQKAARVAAITRDISEVVATLGLPVREKPPSQGIRLAYHDACSLQHGQGIREQPRALLRQAGFELVEIPDGHLCCGSAGTYNLLKPTTAAELGRQKAQAIASLDAQAIASGNIGCMEQISRYAGRPVLHTTQLLDWATGGRKPRKLR